MRPSDRIATSKSCNTAINFFRRIFESSFFSAGVVKLRILFWLLKSTAYFNYCISNVFGIFCRYLLTLRPGSHDQVFCTNFWHQSYETSCKSMTHYCGHLSSITLNSPCEKENQTLESFADFWRRNRTELYFPSKFSKGRRSQRRKLSF